MRKKNTSEKVNISVILSNIAHQLKDLISIIQDMINNKDVLTKSTLYAEVLKSSMRISKKKVLRRIQPVSVRHSRKLMIKSEQKTMKQKRRTSVKIVQNINKRMKEQEKVIAAQRLSSKNIIIICSTEAMKNKLSQKKNILQSFKKEA